jgi:hypothetical protein
MDNSPKYDLDKLLQKGAFQSLDSLEQIFVLEELGSSEAFDDLRDFVLDKDSSTFKTSETSKKTVMDAFDQRYAKKSSPPGLMFFLRVAAAILVLIVGGYFVISFIQNEKSSDLIADKKTRSTEEIDSTQSTAKSAESFEEEKPEIQTPEATSEDAPPTRGEIVPTQTQDDQADFESIAQLQDDLEPRDSFSASEVITATEDQKIREESVAVESKITSSEFISQEDSEEIVDSKIAGNYPQQAKTRAADDQVASEQLSSVQSMEVQSVSKRNMKNDSIDFSSLFKIRIPEKDHYTAY